MTQFVIPYGLWTTPVITYQLADAAEQRPTMPRIPEIITGNSPSDLGFQESKLETDTARADFENRCKKRGRRGLQCGKASHFHLIIYFESHDKERL